MDLQHAIDLKGKVEKANLALSELNHHLSERIVDVYKALAFKDQILEDTEKAREELKIVQRQIEEAKRIRERESREHSERIAKELKETAALRAEAQKNLEDAQNAVNAIADRTSDLREKEEAIDAKRKELDAILSKVKQLIP